MGLDPNAVGAAASRLSGNVKTVDRPARGSQRQLPAGRRDRQPGGGRVARQSRSGGARARRHPCRSPAAARRQGHRPGHRRGAGPTARQQPTVGERPGRSQQRIAQFHDPRPRRRTQVRSGHAAQRRGRTGRGRAQAQRRPDPIGRRQQSTPRRCRRSWRRVWAQADQRASTITDQQRVEVSADPGQPGRRRHGLHPSRRHLRHRVRAVLPAAGTVHRLADHMDVVDAIADSRRSSTGSARCGWCWRPTGRPCCSASARWC